MAKARRARTRIALAVASAFLYACVLAYAIAREPATAGLSAGLGGIGALMLTLVLWRRADDLLAWSLICLGTAYAASLFAHGASVDDRAPLVAAALLLCAELAMWSLDAQYRIAAERRVVAARIVALALLVGGGLAAAGLVVALASTPAGGGLAWSTVGTLAAVLVVALVVGLVRRPG